MSALQSEREKIAATLDEYGIVAVTLNPGSIDPPCVLVDRPTLEVIPRLDCVAVTATFPIKVIGASPGSNEQLARMLDIVEQVLVAIRGATFVDSEPFTRGEQELPAYSRLLLDVINGDPILSIRGDEAEEMWSIVEPILSAWSADRVPLLDYPAGSRGPELP